MKQEIHRLQHALVRYCLSFTESWWEAEDLAQEAWLRILCGNKTDHNNLEALLKRTAKNVWIDAWRRKRIWQRLTEAESRIIADEAKRTDGDSYRKDEMIEAVEVMLETLTPLQRTVLLMRSVFGYSTKETAGLLCTTEGAVKAAYYRAQKQLLDQQEKREHRLASAYNEQAELIVEALREGDAERVIDLVGQPAVGMDIQAAYYGGAMMMAA